MLEVDQIAMVGNSTRSTFARKCLLACVRLTGCGKNYRGRVVEGVGCGLGRC
jgi:hypothetical protein